MDMFTKKQKFLPPEEWVIFKDETGEIVPAIVDEVLWEKANAVLRRRSEDVKGRQGVCNHANLLTGKLWCTQCGKPYYRRESRDRRGEKNSKWLCSGKIKNGADSCASFAIYEEEIRPLLYEVFCDTRQFADAMIEMYLRMYRELTADGTLCQKIELLRGRIELANRKKYKLLQLVTDDSVTHADFKAMTAACNEEIRAAETEIAELKQNLLEGENFRKRIETIRKVLADAQKDASEHAITKDFVEKYIDKTFVTPTEDGALLLQVKIFTGNTAEKYLRRLEARSGIVPGHLFGQSKPPAAAPFPKSNVSVGHMSKKMIEAYERNMQ